MYNSKTGNSKIFFFDSDVLITAKNHYYNPCYAQIFWDWFLDGINCGLFRSAVNVKRELLDGDNDDVLKLMAQDERFDDFWCDTNKTEIAKEFGELQVWANSVWSDGKNKDRKNSAILSVALSTFASDKKADAWLVALASYAQLSTGRKAFVCTNENSAPNAVKRIMIPDAANSRNVKTITLFELLKQYSGTNFAFKGVL